MKFLSFFLWRDIIEISLLACILYYLSLWLKQDHHKKLLIYFYGYCTFIALAYCVQLTTISHLLILFSPLLIMLFVLIHQETLQKNFIALVPITPARPAQSEWLDIMMQTCVTCMNNQQDIICIIERSQALDTLLHTALPVRTDMSKELLNLFLTSPLFDPTTMLWLNTNGMVLGINTLFNKIPDELITSDSAVSWKQQALFFTTKTDALLLKINARQRTLDIIVQGKEYGALTTRTALHLLRKYSGIVASQPEGVTHVYEHTKNHSEQPHS